MSESIYSEQQKKFIVITFSLGIRIAERSFMTGRECDEYVAEALRTGLIITYGRRKADDMIRYDEIRMYICRDGFSDYSDLFTREALGEPYGAQSEHITAVPVKEIYASFHGDVSGEARLANHKAAFDKMLKGMTQEQRDDWARTLGWEVK